MAKDFRYKGKNNQKKNFSVFASERIFIDVSKDATVDHIVCTLPPEVLIVSNHIIVTNAAGTGDTLDVRAGSVLIANELDISSTGTQAGYEKKYVEAGGQVIVKQGDGGDMDEDCEFRVVLEYIELDRTNGEYTV